MRKRPPADLSAALLERLGRVLPAADARSSLSALLALHRLGLSPPPALLDAFCDAVLGWEPAAPPGDRVAALLALGRLRHRVSERWLDAFAAPLLPRLRELPPAGLARLLGALAQLEPERPPALAAAAPASSPRSRTWFLCLAGAVRPPAAPQRPFESPPS